MYPSRQLVQVLVYLVIWDREIRFGDVSLIRDVHIGQMVYPVTRHTAL
jgi:hypothetical protein